ncbi:MAG: cysteine desulfurase [Oscillospiraceae bacterium]|nr:cysteine desulfurase [Oscillospiraceae bacterium]
MIDVAQCRADFPILEQTVHGVPLVYLDNGATTQLPRQVLEAMTAHYTQYNANVHRGIHTLSERATAHLEEARETVRVFLNASGLEEIIFTQGTTDSINTVARGIAPMLQAGDEIVVTQLEHHANFLPWQQLCLERSAVLRVAPQQNGALDVAAFRALLGPRTRLAAVTQVSNVTGAVHPIGALASFVHSVGGLLLVDGAQAVRHESTDVQAMDCDFYCFSGHKMLAPSGIGVLYGKRECLASLIPARYGGGMVDIAGEQSSTFSPLPHRLEAGTGSYAQAIGLGAAIRYLNAVGREGIAQWEHTLLDETARQLEMLAGVTLLGSPAHRAGCLSFRVDGVHPYDLASLLDKQGVAVRSGNHCAQPLLASFGLEVVTRVSPAFYNTRAEIDALCSGIRRATEILWRWSGR